MMIVKEKDVCKECEAICCRNLAVPMTKPRNIAEIDDLRWKLHFDTVKVYIKSRRWYLLIKGKCMYLSDTNLCKIYDRRPEVCREHKSDSCEMTGQWYDKIISSPEELDAYTKQKRKR